MKGSKMRKRQLKFKRKLDEYQDKMDTMVGNFNKLETEFTEKFDKVSEKMDQNFLHINKEIDNSNLKFQNIYDNLEKSLMRFKFIENRINDIDNNLKNLTT